MTHLLLRAFAPGILGLATLAISACGDDTPAFKENALPAGVAVATANGETTSSGDALASSLPESQNSSDNLPASESHEEGLVPNCAQGAMLARAKQVIQLDWSPARLEEGVSAILENRGAGDTHDLGQVTLASMTTLRYTAPQTVSVPAEITIVVRSETSIVGECLVRLIPDESIGVHDDGTTRGLVGSVYTLETNTKFLPDFSTLSPVGDIVVQNLDVPNRSFDYGFPGVDKNLIEWFGISFDGQITIPKTGSYEFRLTADDGARLYLDDELVVNNDGQHSVRSVDGTVTLSQGIHTLRVDYFQGPRYHIALQLLWRPAGSGAVFTIVPPEVLSRPATSL